MLSNHQITKASNEQLIKWIKSSPTSYETKLLEDELRSRILLTRKYSGELS